MVDSHPRPAPDALLRELREEEVSTRAWACMGVGPWKSGAKRGQARARNSARLRRQGERVGQQQQRLHRLQSGLTLARHAVGAGTSLLFQRTLACAVAVEIDLYADAELKTAGPQDFGVGRSSTSTVPPPGQGKCLHLPTFRSNGQACLLFCALLAALSSPLLARTYFTTWR